MNMHTIPPCQAGRGGRPPRCYKLTGSSKETPHVWVLDPLKSIVLEVMW